LWNCGERIAALSLLVVGLPVLALVAAIIAAIARRPPLLTHTRIGQFGESFDMLKFRTMDYAPGYGKAAEGNRFEHTKPFEDPRVSSRFARFCRRFSIDELPQLVHVVSGRMALVGPRPLTRSELELHYQDDVAEILMVRPGLTGLWQVMGRSRLTYRQRRRLDLLLVRKQSARLYLRILLRTIPQVLTGKNSW
jgi:exopolysaccharide production protein ExoY